MVTAEPRRRLLLVTRNSPRRNYPFTLGHLSTWDYFHPNAEGQKILAGL